MIRIYIELIIAEKTMTAVMSVIVFCLLNFAWLKAKVYIFSFSFIEVTPTSLNAFAIFSTASSI